MQLFFVLVLWIILPCFAGAAEVYGVFTGMSLMSPEFPSNGVYTTLRWDLPAGKYAAGDTFKLELPCVYIRVLADTIYLVADGVKYGRCDDVTRVPWMSTLSTYSCKLLPPVNDKVSVRGIVYFPMLYSIGGPLDEAGMSCAKKYKVGSNTLTWSDGKNDLTATMTLGSTERFDTLVGFMQRRDIKDITTLAWTSRNFCSGGYKSITMTEDISGNTLDCKNSHANAINHWNDWFRPTSKLSMSGTLSCSTTKYTATFTDVPAGSRVAIFAKFNSPGDAVITLKPEVRYICAGSTKEETVLDNRKFTHVAETAPVAYGDIITTVTNTYTGSVTRTSTMLAAETSGDRTITVEVDIPTPTTTITSTWTGTETTTITRTATSGGTNTIVIVRPTPVTTLTTTGTNTVETTITETAASSGGTNTVIVVKPTTFSETTLTLTGTGTSEYTITETAASSGGTNTVIVVKPTTVSETTLTLTGILEPTVTPTGTDISILTVRPSTCFEITVTSYGTATRTFTQTAATSGEPDTIVVVKPTLLSTFSQGKYWNTSSTVAHDSIVTSTVVNIVTSTEDCPECAVPTEVPQKPLPLLPVTTDTTLTSSHREQPICTDCAAGESTSAPGAASSGPSGVTGGDAASSTVHTLAIVSAPGAHPNGESSGLAPGVPSSPASHAPVITSGAHGSGDFSALTARPASSSATMPSITSQEGAASYSGTLTWAAIFGFILYFM